MQFVSRRWSRAAAAHAWWQLSALAVRAQIAAPEALAPDGGTTELGEKQGDELRELLSTDLDQWLFVAIAASKAAVAIPTGTLTSMPENTRWPCVLLEFCRQRQLSDDSMIRLILYNAKGWAGIELNKRNEINRHIDYHFEAAAMGISITAILGRRLPPGRGSTGCSLEIFRLPRNTFQHRLPVSVDQYRVRTLIRDAPPC